MSMDNKNIKKTTKKVVEKNHEVLFLKKLYVDFKETLASVFGDAENVVTKHKLLLIIAFIAFLLYRNKQFTIEQFVKRLEGKLKESDLG